LLKEEGARPRITTVAVWRRDRADAGGVVGDLAAVIARLGMDVDI
jgi:hypothetical protein